MKKLELYFNILHYCFYKFDYKLHLWSNKINPFNLIHKLPFQKRKYEELGIDIHSEINKAFGSKNYGLSMLVAGGALMSVLFFFILTLINLWNRIFLDGEILTKEDFIISCALSAVVSYFAVFRRDKYLLYFEDFEKWDNKDRRKYYILSVITAILVPTLLVFSVVL